MQSKKTLFLLNYSSYYIYSSVQTLRPYILIRAGVIADLNDIWALPTGEWVVYSDEDDLIKDFLTLTDLKVVTSYHGLIRKYKAMQFKFPNREDLLKYICRRCRFNYGQVKKLYRRPGNGYNYFYPEAVHQPSLFTDEGPRRKRSRKGK